MKSVDAITKGLELGEKLKGEMEKNLPDVSDVVKEVEEQIRVRPRMHR